MPTTHPPLSTDHPTHISADFAQWQAAGPNDKRSPCPFLNTLANHNFLPHDGRAISKQMVQDAACKAGDFKPKNVGNIYATGAKAIPGAASSGTVDLDQLDMNGVLEHDASISRQDHTLGDSLNLDPWIWRGVLDVIGDRKTIDYETAAKIRHMRIAASKRAHRVASRRGNCDLKALLISYIEIATLFQLFGDTQTREIPVEYFRVFFGEFTGCPKGLAHSNSPKEQERFAYQEGWRPYHSIKERPRIEIIMLFIVLADTQVAIELMEATVVSFRNLVLDLLRMFGVQSQKQD